METNSELEFVYLKSPVIALTCDATLLLKRRWLIAKQSDGGFMETNSELEFVSLKSPGIALRAMPPSFSKRVFLTSFEKGGGAKRRRIFGDKLRVRVCLSQITRHRTSCDATLFFKEGFLNLL